MKHPFAIKHHSESHELVELSHLEKEEVSGGILFTSMMVGEEGGHKIITLFRETGRGGHWKPDWVKPPRFPFGLLR